MKSANRCKASAARRISVRARKGAIMMSAGIAVNMLINNGWAATGTFAGGGNSSWSNSLNWTGLTGGQTYPGATGTTTNTDEALFNASNTNSTITNDLTYNLQTIYFTLGAGGFNIGQNSASDNSILMTNGGLVGIDMNETSSSNNVIYAPLVMEGANLTLQNNSTTIGGLEDGGATQGGGISGGVAGTATLTLAGDNFNTTNTSNNVINGPISNGLATTLNLVMDDSTTSGVWQLNGTNTYNGSTTVEGGILRVTGSSAIPATSNVIVEGTGVFRGSVEPTFPTVNSITFDADGGGNITVSNSEYGFNIAASSGPGLTININSANAASTTNTYSFNLNLTGTVAGQDGITLNNGPNAPQVSFGSSTYTYNLGSVSRTFNIGLGGQNLNTTGGNTTDLQVNGNITGSGGIIKTGLGTLKLEYRASTNGFTGQLEIQAGSVKMPGQPYNNQLSGSNSLLIDQTGNLNINGANLTFGGGATFEGGSTSYSTSNATTEAAAIIAPSYTFDVTTSNTFQMENVMPDYTPQGGNTSTPAAVTSDGPGTVTISDAVPTYTGGTTITNGLYIVNVGGMGLSTGAVVVNSPGVLQINAPNSPTTSTVTIPGNVSGSGSTTVNSAVVLNVTNFSQGGGLLNNGSVTMTGSGSVGTVTGTGSLSLGSTASLQLSHGSGGSAQNSLVITAGGKLDITNNHLIINYGSNPSPKATILGYLVSGANGGEWNGTGIISSTAASQYSGNPGNYGVSFSDAADAINPALTSGQIEVAYSQYGDITQQGLVNAADFHILASNFGQTTTNGWEAGDFLYQGVVNAEDFHLLAENFGQTASGESISMPASDWEALDSFAAANGITPAVVPEPAVLGLLALGGVGLLQRRRRRQS